jgi:hypothetical protein
MAIYVKDIRTIVEKKYIGFGPNTNNVKPVHLANGFFRRCSELRSETELLNRFVIVSKANGEVPLGYDIDVVISDLVAHNRILPEAKEKVALNSLRTSLKKVINADTGVFLHRDRMESYSAGNVHFLSEDRIAQDGGEFVAGLLQKAESPLVGCVLQALNQGDDIITIMCLPLLFEDCHQYVSEDNEVQESVVLEALAEIDLHLLDSASHLSLHLERHPNKLVKLRLAILFTSFFILRYLACLEALYVPGASRQVSPFLLDLLEKTSNPVHYASLMTYNRVCQAISRFYAWAIGEYLSELYSPEDLKRQPPPQDGQNRRGESVKYPEERKEIWETATSQVVQSEDPFTVYGQAIYDIMLLDANASPIHYFRQLGLRSGLLWPPNQSARTFQPKQDFLEMLVRSVVIPGESISLPSLQNRLWRNFGIVVGGQEEDQERLFSSGIHQVDESSLAENKKAFVSRLDNLNFVSLLADGVLSVGVGS